MSTSNAELLRSTYDALAQGDVAAVFAALSADITWHIPGRNPTSGDYTGHDEVGRFFQTLAERSNGTFKLDVHDILDNGQDRVVALVTENAERNGARLASSTVHVWRVADGKLTSFQCFDGDDHEVDAFWA
jgi:ketosteroid isomerase-like protein